MCHEQVLVEFLHDIAILVPSYILSNYNYSSGLMRCCPCHIQMNCMKRIWSCNDKTCCSFQKLAIVCDPVRYCLFSLEQLAVPLLSMQYSTSAANLAASLPQIQLIIETVFSNTIFISGNLSYMDHSPTTLPFHHF